MADTEFILEQLETFANAMDRHKPDPLSEPDELAARVLLALTLFDATNQESARQEEKLQGNRGSQRDAYLRTMHRLWDTWYRGASRLVAAISPGDKSHGDTRQRLRLHDLVEEVRNFLRFNIEQTIQGLHDADEGRTTSLSEVRDELRRRSGRPV